MRGQKVDLKLIIFPSCIAIIVLGCPPLLEETSGVIAIIRIEGV